MSEFKVLIIEDNSELAETIQRRMMLEEITSIIMEIKSKTIKLDVEKIINVIKEEWIDLVILDYVYDKSPVLSTPETNGLYVLRHIRELDKYLPVLLFTGYPSDINQNELSNMSIDFIVLKGDEDAIITATNNYIDKKDEVIRYLELIIRDDPKFNKPVFTAEGKPYSFREILEEIKKGSIEGRELYNIYKTGLTEVYLKLKK